MATLQSFQSEIEDIHNREVAKQRASNHTSSAPMPEKDLKGKAKASVTPSAQTLPDHKEVNNAEPQQEVEDSILVSRSENPWIQVPPSPISANLPHNQAQLLTENPVDHNNARDQIASLLIRNNGEYVLIIGEQPPRAKLYTNDVDEGGDGWTGTPHTATDLDILRERITAAVDEVGGKVYLPPAQSHDNPSDFCIDIGAV